MAKKEPHPVDVYVGGKILESRKSKGMSQTKLGDAVGVSFQQIQKYENGKNCVSMSALWVISHALNTPIDHFFPKQGVDKTHDPGLG